MSVRATPSRVSDAVQPSGREQRRRSARPRTWSGCCPALRSSMVHAGRWRPRLGERPSNGLSRRGNGSQPGRVSAKPGPDQCDRGRRPEVGVALDEPPVAIDAAEAEWGAHPRSLPGSRDSVGSPGPIAVRLAATRPKRTGERLVHHDHWVVGRARPSPSMSTSSLALDHAVRATGR
jgi:hypothetical protein